jgi:hypothetical protein
MTSLVCCALLVSAAFAAAPVPEKLTWNDLINHPERWPDSTKVTANLKFGGNDRVAAGTAVKINGVTPRGAELIAPAGFVFNAAPKDCDLLDAANGAWAKLTPEQRALTPASVEQDKSLWPGQITMTSEADFNSFKLGEGKSFKLLLLRGKDAGLFVPGQEGVQLVDVPMTDLFKRSRDAAAQPRDKRAGRMGELLDGLTVDQDGKPTAVPGGATYYVHYWSASTCPRCAVFTPKLVEHYNKVLAGRKDVVFFGSPTDATMPPYYAYVKQRGMPWPTVPNGPDQIFLRVSETQQIEIPGLIVFDKFGNVLLSTAKMRGEPLPVAEQALAKLDDVLKPTP